MEYTTKDLLPVLSTKNFVIFPGTATPIRVAREKSKAATSFATENDGFILVVAQRPEKVGDDDAKASDLYRIATLCKIEKVRGSQKDGYQILLRGVGRYSVSEYIDTKGFIQARAEPLSDVLGADAKTVDALLESLKKMALEILGTLQGDTEQVAELVSTIHDLSYLSYLCAGQIDIPIFQKQELLESSNVKDRVLRLLELMQSQRDRLQVQSEIRDRLTHKLGKHQRDAILREQLKAIREELGETDETGPGGKDDYREKIKNAKMPETTEKLALDELKRLESMGNTSPESHVIRNYLDLLVSLPWSHNTETPEIDLDAARDSLNRDHYGLDKIKNRIIQHLAVMKLKKDKRGSILLFVGPPGVGKTSLGQSIAKALGRKFVRGSLGGVRDDSEIRGHRRTYIGAMPGRIIQGIKRASENNPVFMLDEIDKLGRGFQGDPASALLEVLDPEQNATFLDHYLDVPFDLSNVVFIATANSLESIPGPLLDRMEVIDLSGYTTAEKKHIAETHLIPKQWSEHGVTSEQLKLSDEALQKIIAHYTREAGVRDLQRKLANVVRASTERILKKDAVLPVVVGPEDLDEILGAERFTHEVIETSAPPGLVTGLAWTPMGGEILFIESTLMPGSGQLILTGQLGDVMKESARIALSLVRSRLPMLTPVADWSKTDLHIHVPAGAIPKDGPSAGVALLTTLASLFSGIGVDPKLAMTGEVTLRGAVTPVGGIKEKVMAAHRAGIEKVILSRKNERDLRDVPIEVRSQMKFEFADTVSDVLKIALGLELSPLPLVNGSSGASATAATAVA
jgi:ATP-dependent Lon protease